MAGLQADGFDPQGDLLAQLLELNLAVAQRIADGEEEAVTPPGVPADYPNRQQLVTDDCIQPE